MISVQQGVADQHRKLKFRPGLNVHVETPVLRKSQEILDHVIVRLEGVDKNKYQRHQPENRAKENKAKVTIELPASEDLNRAKAEIKLPANKGLNKTNAEIDL